MAIWVGFLVVSSMLVFAFLRQRAQASRKQVATKSTPRSPYQSVTVKRQVDACAAVTSLDGQRIISSDAPSFPLPNCDAKQCNCRYQFHGDRRDTDRRLLGGCSQHSFIVMYGGDDKRDHDDRRCSES